MKLLRIVIAAVFVLGAGGAYAFHSGGVAECGGCHNMHAPAAPFSGESYLLNFATASDTCLDCHASPDTAPTRYHVMTYPAGGVLNTTVPVERTPGGDFAWLGITTTATPRPGTVNTFPGQTRGHNVVAPGFGISVDTDNAVAPGAQGAGFPSANLGCNSCHDPHGKLRRIGNSATLTGDQAGGYLWGRTGAPIAGSGSYTTSMVPTAAAAVGAYRILRGVGDTDAGVLPAVPANGFRGRFLAIAPNTPSYAWNATEAVNPIRVAYGVDGGAGLTDTVGQWCASCHPDMHSVGTTQPLVHPIDTQLGTFSTNYQNYVSSGIMTGTSATSFLSLVPFATNTGDFASLKTLANANGSNLIGPATNDQVMCLSCHRSHASGFKYMLRWNYETGEFLTRADALGAVQWAADNAGTGLSQAQVNAAYQDIPATKFGLYQRQLCNKCHVKD